MLLGGAGDDVLLGGGGIDVLDGGAGDDIEIQSALQMPEFATAHTDFWIGPTQVSVDQAMKVALSRRDDPGQAGTTGCGQKATKVDFAGEIGLRAAFRFIASFQGVWALPRYQRLARSYLIRAPDERRTRPCAIAWPP